MFLKQSTSATIKMGPFVDDADGVTALTSLTIQKADVRLSKNGGNMAAASADQGASDAGAAHDELGYYDISLNATDTNTLGSLRVMISESGGLPVWRDFTVLAANVYDSLVGGGDYLQVDALQVEGSDATDQINAACDTAVSDAALATAAEVAKIPKSDGSTSWNATALGAISAQCDTAISDAALATAAALATLDGKADDILEDTAEIGTAGAGLTEAGGTGDHLTALASAASTTGLVDGVAAVFNAIGNLNDVSAAEVNAQVDAALADYDPPTRTEATADKDAILLKLLAYFQLALRKDAAIATDRATELTALNANEGSGAGAYSQATDSQEAIRDRGDAAWTGSGGGGGDVNVVTIDGADAMEQLEIACSQAIDSRRLDELMGNGALAPGSGSIMEDVLAIEANVLAKVLKYVRLMVRKDAFIGSDHSAELSEINANAGSGGGNYLNTSDAQEAIRDRGDSAWLQTAIDDIQDGCTAAIAAASLATAAGLTSGLAALQSAIEGAIEDLNDPDAAAIATAVWSAASRTLTAAGLDAITPSQVTGFAPTTIPALIKHIHQRLLHKTAQNKTTGKQTHYLADGTTVGYVHDLTDDGTTQTISEAKAS